MNAFLLQAYPWIKSLHVIAVIAWMAGLLYLPRLFVYHCESGVGSEQSETFKVMEENLAKMIMQPAMIATLVFGLCMISIPGTPGYLPHAGYWLWLKLALVAGLLVSHWFEMQWRAGFAADRNKHPQRFFRMMNEVPTVLMVGIVISVIVKPF
jgi:putative membrane protein